MSSAQFQTSLRPWRPIGPQQFSVPPALSRPFVFRSSGLLAFAEVRLRIASSWADGPASRRETPRTWRFATLLPAI